MQWYEISANKKKNNNNNNHSMIWASPQTNMIKTYFLQDILVPAQGVHLF